MSTTPHLDPRHFLSLPRPDVAVGPPTGVPDTSTLAAHDFDVDPRTGFMPPQPSLSRLPSEWESWEAVLDEAQSVKLRLGDTPGLPEAERDKSEAWRSRVRDMPVLPTVDLQKSEFLLRRAHHVLGWIMHFYVHSLPPGELPVIPAPISLPLLHVSKHLQIPPILTYSDDVLYNWELKDPNRDQTQEKQASSRGGSPDFVAQRAPALDNLRCQTLFTGMRDEEEFYLTSARIELRGVAALELMQAIMDEAFVGDALALRRIASYLDKMTHIIKDLRAILLSVREACNPDVFYHLVRPWFRGVDSDPAKPRWIFEGLERDGELKEPEELSGPSAGQSSLVHALDIFLGVDQYSHTTFASTPTTTSTSSAGSSTCPSQTKTPFLDRMQCYMPRHHRTFLRHLASAPRPLRSLVQASRDDALLRAYNAAVVALKEFRDAHMVIVALYIIAPSKRPPPENLVREGVGERRAQEDKAYGMAEEQAVLKGTGGTELVRFLKDVRERTTAAVLPPFSDV